MSRVCDACHGTGVEKFYESFRLEPVYKPCWSCDGTGTLPPPHVSKYGPFPGDPIANKREAA